MKQRCYLWLWFYMWLESSNYPKYHVAVWSFFAVHAAKCDRRSYVCETFLGHPQQDIDMKLITGSAVSSNKIPSFVYAIKETRRPRQPSQHTLHQIVIYLIV